MKLKSLFISIIILTVFNCVARSGVPGQIAYQGKLTDGSGQSLNGTYSFNFLIYNNASSLMWGPATQSVQVINGLYSVILSTDNSNSSLAGLAFDTTYYLEIKVGSETLSPRLPFATSPYAFRSAHADVADVLSSTFSNISPSSISAGTLPNNVIASSIAVNSVYPGAISAGTYPSIIISSIQAGDYEDIRVGTATTVLNFTGTVPAGNVSAGPLGGSVIASSIAVNSVYPGAISAGTYPDIVISSIQTGAYENVRVGTATTVLSYSGAVTAGNVSAGALGNGVIVSSIAVNSIYPGAVSAGTYPSIVISSIQTGAYENVSVGTATVALTYYGNVPAVNISAGSLGSGVIASSIAVNSVYPGAVSAGTYPSIVISSIQAGDYEGIRVGTATTVLNFTGTVPAGNISAGPLGSSVIVSSVALNSVYPGAISAGTYPSIVISSIQTGAYENVSVGTATIALTYSGTIPAVNVSAGTIIDNVKITTGSIVGGTLPNNVVTSSVSAGVIYDANISNDASISGSKLNSNLIVSSITATGFVGLPSVTDSWLQNTAPSAVGQLFYCNDLSSLYNGFVFVSTGTTAGSFAQVNAPLMGP